MYVYRLEEIIKYGLKYILFCMAAGKFKKKKKKKPLSYIIVMSCASQRHIFRVTT